MNPDDPFSNSGDGDRTVIRPTPGGRRPAGASPPPSPRPSGPGRPAALLLPGGTGLNPLVESAAALLGLARQLRSSVAHPDPGGLRNRVLEGMRRFEADARAKGITDAVVLPARYALCSLLDETVLATPWGSESLWSKQGLLITFHNEAWGGEKFFALLQRLMAYPAGNLDLLELMYLCLALGFEGRYRVRNGGRTQLDQLREHVYQSIRGQRGAFEPELSPNWRGIVERRDPLIRQVPLWVLSAFAAALLLALFTGFSFALNSASDPVFVELHNLDKGLPIITAGTRPPLQVPTRAPAPTAPALTLRLLLAEEIGAGMLEVIDRNQGQTVIIRGDGLFQSARARVNPEHIPLLTRIGEALAQLPGRVLVTGHTDSLPIQTLRFPSNWHLSQTRAVNVAKILAEVTAEPARFGAEGRAATEPLIPENPRDSRNRRVEITLMTPRSSG